MGIFSTIGSFLGGPVGGAIGSLGDTALSNSHNNASIGRAGADRIAGYDQGIASTNQLLDPYTKGLGTPAAGKLAELLGLSGDTAGAMDALKQNPVYQSLFHNGEETVLQDASATGGLRGGNTQHSLANVGVDTLAKVYQMMVGNLGDATALGARTGLGQAGLLGNLDVGRGNAAATMVLDKIGLGADNKTGTGANNTSGSLDIGSILQNLGQLFGGSGGGGGGSGGFGALEGLF